MKHAKQLRPSVISSSFRLSEQCWKDLDAMARAERRSKTIVLEKLIADEVKRREGKKKSGSDEEEK